jgi:hypothetical protein
MFEAMRGLKKITRLQRYKAMRKNRAHAKTLSNTLLGLHALCSELRFETEPCHWADHPFCALFNSRRLEWSL